MYSGGGCKTSGDLPTTFRKLTRGQDECEQAKGEQDKGEEDNNGWPGGYMEPGGEEGEESFHRCYMVDGSFGLYYILKGVH